MYAIVEISGKQFKVEKNKFIYTDKVEPKSGKKSWVWQCFVNKW